MKATTFLNNRVTRLQNFLKILEEHFPEATYRDKAFFLNTTFKGLQVLDYAWEDVNVKVVDISTIQNFDFRFNK